MVEDRETLSELYHALSLASIFVLSKGFHGETMIARYLMGTGGLKKESGGQKW